MLKQVTNTELIRTMYMMRGTGSLFSEYTLFLNKPIDDHWENPEYVEVSTIASLNRLCTVGKVKFLAYPGDPLSFIDLDREITQILGRIERLDAPYYFTLPKSYADDMALAYQVYLVFVQFLGRYYDLDLWKLADKNVTQIVVMKKVKGQ